jgi:hypothetical protein
MNLFADRSSFEGTQNALISNSNRRFIPEESGEIRTRSDVFFWPHQGKKLRCPEF